MARRSTERGSLSERGSPSSLAPDAEVIEPLETLAVLSTPSMLSSAVGWVRVKDAEYETNPSSRTRDSAHHHHHHHHLPSLHHPKHLQPSQHTPQPTMTNPSSGEPVLSLTVHRRQPSLTLQPSKPWVPRRLPPFNSTLLPHPTTCTSTQPLSTSDTTTGAVRLALQSQPRTSSSMDGATPHRCPSASCPSWVEATSARQRSISVMATGTPYQRSNTHLTRL